MLPFFGCTQRATAWVRSASGSRPHSAAAVAFLLFSSRATRPARAYVHFSGSLANPISYGATHSEAATTTLASKPSSTTMAHADTATTVDTARSSSSLEELLKSSSSGLREVASADSNALVHAYVGNEACDADSICSSIGMALLAGPASREACEDTSGANKLAIEGDHAVVHTPVVPIPRADLALRREMLVLFDLCGVDPTLLTFIDEVDLLALQAQGRLRLTLMDHNAVSGPLSGLGDTVVEIVDHHKDLAQHTHVQGDARDIAFESADGNAHPLVGSCCTLVAERLIETAPALLSANVARLLLGVILIDTVNLDAGSKRAMPRDLEVAQELSQRIAGDPATSAISEEPSEGDKADADGSADGNVEDPQTSANVLFEKLRDAKFDQKFWRELTAQDCLRYDYKQFTPRGSGPGEYNNPDSFGMSSVLCRLEILAGKEGIGDALGCFALKRQLDSLVVMTATFDISTDNPGMRRELLVFVSRENEKRLEDMKAFLEGPGGEFMQLQKSTAFDGVFDGSGSDGGYVAYWELGNPRPSRKQVAPAVMSFYESANNS